MTEATIRRTCTLTIRPLAFLAFLLFVDGVRACSCVPPAPPCEAFWQADAVFVAAVRSKSVVTTEEGQQVSVRFLVDEVYRGLLGGSDVEVLTGMSSDDCGFNFEKGKRYLVYCHRTPKQISNRSV